MKVQCLVLKRSYCNLLYRSVDLPLSYTVELDKKKAYLESESNAFRRMFFMDDLTKERIFVISGVHNLTKQRDTYCSRPRTVYLKVFKSSQRKLRRLLASGKAFTLSLVFLIFAPAPTPSLLVRFSSLMGSRCRRVYSMISLCCRY